MPLDPSDDYLKRRADDGFDLELPASTPWYALALFVIIDLIERLLR